MDFGTIESIEVTQNLETGELVRLAQVNILDEDTVSVELPFPEGDEFVPAAGDRVYFEEQDAGWLVARCIQTIMDVDGTLSDGERELFSRLGTLRSATVRLKSDGEIILNAGDDYAVKFEKLESAMESLQTDINNILSKIYTHTHPVAGSTASMSVELTVPPIINPTVDISDAKVDKVRL